MTTSPPSNTVREQAAGWVMRLQTEDCSDADRRACQAWLSQHESHPQAYREMQSFWQDLGQSPKQPSPELAAARAYLHRPRRAFTRFRTFAAAALILVAIAPYGWTWLHTQHYRTAKGEQTRISLQDGSIIQLNTDSQLSVNDSFTSRTVMLERGEAFFDVVHDEAKLFEVIAAQGHIRDIGTRFNVAHHNGQVAVTVLEGEVDVTGLKQNASQSLTANQAISYDASGELSAVRGVDIKTVTAWQRQEMVFKNQPLSTVLTELARYHDVNLQIPDPRLQALKVSGVFPTHNLQLTLATLADALPVKVLQKPGGQIVLQAKK